MKRIRIASVVAVLLVFVAGTPLSAAEKSSPPPTQTVDAKTQEAFRKGEEFAAKEKYADALRWYRVAADGGHLESQNNVGMFLVSGMGGRKDLGEGVRWLRKAAERGHDVAQRNMGFLYMQGLGVPKDRAEALRWLRKAADQGDEEAKAGIKMLGAK
jgi:TPR repeat protein